MMDNIDKIINGTKIDIFGIDKEIDYSKLKKLEKEEKEEKVGEQEKLEEKGRKVEQEVQERR